MLASEYDVSDRAFERILSATDSAPRILAANPAAAQAHTLVRHGLDHQECRRHIHSPDDAEPCVNLLVPKP